MLLISGTYSTVTPESAAEGEAADSGFDFEDVAYTFRELVDLIQRDGFVYPSNSRPTGSRYEWLSSAPELDYSDCSETTHSLHYSHANKPHNARYWRLAFKAAGLL